MGKEEQQEEREVLDSIFPDEITDISEIEYRVSIQLEVTQAEEDETPPRRSIDIQLVVVARLMRAQLRLFFRYSTQRRIRTRHQD